jgi:hypothetical protein
MNIETAITQLTEAVKENTAALREILSVGAVTAADTLVPAPAKKRKAEPTVKENLTVQPELAVEPEPEPVAEETTAPEPTPEPKPIEDTPQVPDLPVAELRNSLKEVIKGKLLGDTEGQIKQTFDALRQKYGVSVIKELTDDQVAPFYGEVLTWG